MDLLKFSIKECNPKPEDCQIYITKLDWCAEDNLNVPVFDNTEK